jgi:methyl coenzyme M reductase subunit C
MVASALNRKAAGCPEWRHAWEHADIKRFRLAPERRQNRLAGSMVCGRKQVCKPACEIVYSRRPKIARDLCLLSSTAIAVETISFISG